MEVKFTLLANAVMLRVGGKVFNIHSEDPRYAEVAEAIKTKDFSKIMEIAHPGSFLKKDGFTVKDGLVHYKDAPLPATLSNQFKSFKDRGVDFVGLVNFWYNLKTRESFQSSQEKLEQLITYNGYPFTKDGFIVLFHNPAFKKEQELKIANSDTIRFYDYGYADPAFRTLFDNRRTFEEVLTHVFGFETRKLHKLAYEQMFIGNNTRLKTEFLNYGLALKGILSPNNLFEVIEKKMLPLSRSDYQYTLLNSFFKVILKTKETKTDEKGEVHPILSEKRLINLLSKPFELDHLFGSAIIYEQILKNTDVGWNIDLSEMSFSSFTELYDFLTKEQAKIDPNNYPLDVTENYPEVVGLEDEVYSGLKFVIPKRNSDLVKWGQIMSNCIGGYGQSVKQKQTLVLGLMDADTGKMIYNLEINDHKVRQFKSKNNKAALGFHKNLIMEVLRQKNIIRE